MSRTHNVRTYLLVALALAVAPLGLTACGGSGDDSNNSASGVDIEAVAGTEPAYTTDSATAAAGKVTINFTNPQATPHNVDIAYASGGDILKGKRVTEGSNSEKVDLESGNYIFYCSVSGHQEAGMEGTLKIE